MRSAVVLPVELPEPLESFRQTHVAEAPLGVPAHVTLLYPFVAPDRLATADRERLAARVAGFAPFEYRLASIERWPDTLYVAPEPALAFDSLAAGLSNDWPDWPLYGGGVRFEAHVTLGEPGDEESEAGIRTLGRTCLPALRRATEALLITEGSGGRWSTRWRLPLGG